MTNSFWSNSIWYILVLILSLIELVAALLKSKNRVFTIVFTFATAGFVYRTGHFSFL